MRRVNLWWLQGWLYEALFALKPHRQLVRSVAAQFTAADNRVLDAGCGTGRLATWTSAEVVGVDFSSTMLRPARQRCTDTSQADLNIALPFEDAAFGGVASINVLYTLADPGFTVEQMARVLRPGGKLILATPTTPSLAPLLLEHFKTAGIREELRFLANTPRLLAWCVNLVIRGFFDHSDFLFLPEEEVVALIEGAGLTVEKIERSYAGIDVLVTARKGV